MKFQKFIQTLLLVLLSVFINLNIVDDRFVSPLEDLSHQYQSYELEETTRVLVVRVKKQEQVSVLATLPDHFDRSAQAMPQAFPSESDFLFSFFHLSPQLLNLPPPSFV